MKLIPYTLAGLFLAPLVAFAQPNQSEVRLFQNFFLDGSQVGQVYGDVGLVFSDFDNVNVLDLGGRIGFPIGNTFELGVELHYFNFDPVIGEDRSGVSDINVTGRVLVSNGPTNISVGGALTVPVGDEDIGQGNVNINAFGAIRHPAGNRLAITGVLGIEFMDRNDDYDASLRLGGGLIFQTNQGWHIVGELNFLTERDYALLTAGIDYALGSSARIRPALGLGLDNGAPDLALLLGILFM